MIVFKPTYMTWYMCWLTYYEPTLYFWYKDNMALYAEMCNKSHLYVIGHNQ